MQEHERLSFAFFEVDNAAAWRVERTPRETLQSQCASHSRDPDRERRPVETRSDDADQRYDTEQQDAGSSGRHDARRCSGCFSRIVSTFITAVGHETREFEMFKLLIRLVVNGVSIWAAAQVVDGVTLDTHHVWGVVLVALVFGIVNTLLKPLATLLSLPFIILTLGLFTLVVNAGLFGLTAWMTDALVVDSFGAALWGALIVSIVSWFLGLFLSNDDDGAAE
jgi:putative membrane protein